MTDLPVKPHRKTLRQTAIILNVSVKTVRRYLLNGRLKWSGDQVSMESIMAELTSEKIEESSEAVEEKLDNETKKKPVRRTATSDWINGWR